jgi:hypothetical protein
MESVRKDVEPFPTPHHKEDNRFHYYEVFGILPNNNCQVNSLTFDGTALFRTFLNAICADCKRTFWGSSDL